MSNEGIAQRPEAENGKVFVVAVVDDAQMAHHVETLKAQIFEAGAIPRFNAFSALRLGTPRQQLDAIESKS